MAFIQPVIIQHVHSLGMLLATKIEFLRTFAIDRGMVAREQPNLISK